MDWLVKKLLQLPNESDHVEPRDTRRRGPLFWLLLLAAAVIAAAAPKILPSAGLALLVPASASAAHR